MHSSTQANDKHNSFKKTQTEVERVESNRCIKTFCAAVDQNNTVGSYLWHVISADVVESNPGVSRNIDSQKQAKRLAQGAISHRIWGQHVQGREHCEARRKTVMDLGSNFARVPFQHRRHVAACSGGDCQPP